jgi:squalene cyclase
VAHTPGLDRAVDFVCGQQEPDGCWRDWRLPPGESRMWTTAYVGYRLTSLCGTRHDTLAPALSRAAAWLQSATLPGGGWGYSAVAGPDADSTALAITFLRSVDKELPAGAVATLLRHQQDDGGFATFTPEWSHGAWIVSHPDVTATALVALARLECAGTAESLDRGLRYLWRHRATDELWKSYWWTSPLYATEAVSACLAALDQPLRAAELGETLSAWRDGSVFDAALRLLMLERIGAAGSEATRECALTLEQTQLADGGWPSAAELRLTDRQVYEPWLVANSGPVFRDERRLFTTVTAMSALASVEGPMR